jgi:hypothetical protein
MKTTLIVIQNEADHADAKRFIEKLMGSSDSQDRARLIAQARLVEAYERTEWPRTAPSLPVLLGYLMDQHSSDGNKIRNSGFSLFPQIRSEASHNTISACFAASSYSGRPQPPATRWQAGLYRIQQVDRVFLVILTDGHEFA